MWAVGCELLLAGDCSCPRFAPAGESGGRAAPAAAATAAAVGPYDAVGGGDAVEVDAAEAAIAGVPDGALEAEAPGADDSGAGAATVGDADVAAADDAEDGGLCAAAAAAVNEDSGDEGDGGGGSGGEGEGGDEEQEEDGVGPVHVLPLYALLSMEAQMAVFGDVPAGARLIVVATNVAETSLTIPGIRYVVDAGRVKRRVWDVRAGTSRYEVGWISQASAGQRSGRAGRVGPGHAYRLYSSAVFDRTFEAFEPPEVARMPVDGVVLALAALGIRALGAFPFPTPPPPAAVAAAVRSLTALGALEPGTCALTPSGRALAAFPVAPRVAKLLLIAAGESGSEGGGSGGFGAWAVTLAAALSVQEPFIRPPRESPEAGGARKRRRELACVESDAITVVNAIAGLAAAGGAASYCENHFLSAKVLWRWSCGGGGGGGDGDSGALVCA